MFIFLPVSYPDPDPNPCYRSPGSQSTVGAKNGRRGGGHLRLGHERRAHLRVEVDRSVAHRVQQCKHRMLNYRKMPSSRQSPTECIYRMILRRQPEMFAKENRVLDPFRTAVPFWGQTTWKLRGLSPIRDCGSKRVNQRKPNVFVSITENQSREWARRRLEVDASAANRRGHQRLGQERRALVFTLILTGQSPTETDFFSRIKSNDSAKKNEYIAEE